MELYRTSHNFLLKNTCDLIFFTPNTSSDPRSLLPDPISHFFIDSLIHHWILAAVCRVAIIRVLKKLANTEHTSHHKPKTVTEQISMSHKCIRFTFYFLLSSEKCPSLHSMDCHMIHQNHNSVCAHYFHSSSWSPGWWLQCTSPTFKCFSFIVVCQCKLSEQDVRANCQSKLSEQTVRANCQSKTVRANCQNKLTVRASCQRNSFKVLFRTREPD